MKPLSLLEKNPRFFEFRSQPTCLITSAEHYGSALNPDFDYVAHLDELQRCGFNQARLFSGFYVEEGKDHGIVNNTLAPAHGRFLAPWARSDQPGYAFGGNRFDLSRWDERFWERMHGILQAASDRGIVIELSLFCMIYNSKIWGGCPLNPKNHINGGPEVDWLDALGPDQPELRSHAKALVEKYVEELNGYDNLYWELGNEVYNRPCYRDFLEDIARFLRQTEDRLPHRHLIALNEENRTKRITDPIPEVDVYHFHYAIPASVGENYGLARPIVDDETGFAGSDFEPYRKEAWQFMIAGGAGFSHLDYSFTVGHPDGSHVVDSGTPGVGGPEWRAQVTALARFINDLEFWKMEPRNDLIRTMNFPPGVEAHLLADEGRDYAIYLYGQLENARLGVGLVGGRWSVAFTDPATGNAIGKTEVEGGFHGARIDLPEYATDLAIRIRRQGSRALERGFSPGAP